MDKHCNLCEGKFFNQELNICTDSEIFLNKKNIKEIVCRYNENAIPFSSVEEYNEVSHDTKKKST